MVIFKHILRLNSFGAQYQPPCDCQAFLLLPLPTPLQRTTKRRVPPLFYIISLIAFKAQKDHSMQRSTQRQIYLADLTIRPIVENLCVRVMRKWIYNGNIPGGEVSYLGFVLADEKGDSIYAEIKKPDVEKMGPLLEADKTYLMTRFNVRTSRTSYIPFERQYMIQIGSLTKIIAVKHPPDTFPLYVYNITPFSHINGIPAGSTRLFDFLGILTSVDTIRQQPLSQQERVAMLRDVTIKDMSDQQLKITLWDERTTEFIIPEASASTNNQSIVVLFLGCLAKRIGRQVYVNGGYPCRWYFNPNIREAQPLYNKLDLNPVPVYCPPPQIEDPGHTIQPIIHEHRSLYELNYTDPFEFPDTGYKCSVTITSISQEKKWFYIGCASCKKAQRVESVPFKCQVDTCGHNECTPFYKLDFTAKDETAEAKFFSYDDASRRIVQRNITTLFSQYRKHDELPQAVKDIVGRTYTFLVRPTNDSFSDMANRTYQVKAVLASHTTQLSKTNQLLLTAASPSQPLNTQPTPLLTSGQIDETEQTHRSPETSTENALAILTPPPLSDVDQTPEKAVVARSAQSTPLVPKQLFTDETHTLQQQTTLTGKHLSKQGSPSQQPQTKRFRSESAQKITDSDAATTTSASVKE